MTMEDNDLSKGIKDIRVEMEQKAVAPINTILKEYKKSLENIKNEIAKLYLKYSVDGVLKVSEKQRANVLLYIEKKLIDEMRKLGDIDETETIGLLKEVFGESYYKTAYEIDKGMDINLNVPLLTTEFINSAINMPIKGEMFSDRIWSNKKKLLNRVRADVKSAVIEGIPIDKLVAQIKKDYGVSAYESRRLIYNEVARCVGSAQDEIYRKTDAVVEVMFDATLDNKTSKICIGLDGKRFSKDEHPIIPEDTHVNCRSCIIPVVEGWNPTVKRENIKGEDGEKPVIDYTDYKSWAESRGIDK